VSREHGEVKRERGEVSRDRGAVTINRGEASRDGDAVALDCGEAPVCGGAGILEPPRGPPRALSSPPMRRPLSLALAGLALAAVPACSHPGGEDPSLLTERVWLDSQPEKPTDYVNAAFFLSSPSLGVFQKASGYDMHVERFDHRRDGHTLELTFPQTGKKATFTFTITPCATLPPYDLCLDLSENPWGGPKRYFGKRQQDDEDESLRGMRARLRTR
jgi:hypothetical protein